MAKELPFFKFESNAWDTGNIQMCSRESKGLFVDMCSLYWSRLGELPYALALQKLCNGSKDAMQELINHEIIGVIDGQIIIEFLDEQLLERGETSGKRRDAANKRWKDASALQVQSKSNASRGEESREEKKNEEKKPARAYEVPFVNGCLVAWEEWEQYLKEKKKKLTPSTAKKQFKFLGGRADPEIIAIINQAIEKGWIGLYELKKDNNGTTNGKFTQTTLRRSDAIVETPDDYGKF
jgi:hypothetical protein